TEGYDEFPAGRKTDEQGEYAERSDSEIQRPRPSDPVADPTPGKATQRPPREIDRADISADIIHLICRHCTRQVAHHYRQVNRHQHRHETRENIAQKTNCKGDPQVGTDLLSTCP